MSLKTAVSVAAALTMLAVGSAWSQDSGNHSNSEASETRSFERSAKDAWIHGKLEAVYSLNRHLNPFAIDTDVENGIVTLRGTVESDIDRDLAEELAKGIENVAGVNNHLTVDTDEMSSKSAADADTHERPFGQWVEDATTTAAVKSKLVANSNVSGMSIDVDTWYDVVTLRGEVDSDEQRDLAEQLALNTSDVERVQNELSVKNDS